MTARPRPTRFDGLQYTTFGPRDWRFCMDNDPYQTIGPIYQSKAELLADMAAFAAVRGFDASGTGGEAEANARLIADAPALLARCEAAEARLAACADVEAVVVRMCQQADAALARADYWAAQSAALAGALEYMDKWESDGRPVGVHVAMQTVRTALATYRGAK